MTSLDPVVEPFGFANPKGFSIYTMACTFHQKYYVELRISNS